MDIGWMNILGQMNYRGLIKIYNMDYLRFESLKIFFGVSENNHDNVFENMIQSFDWIDDSKRIDNLVRFERHVRLSCQQRDYMDKVASGARKVLFS